MMEVSAVGFEPTTVPIEVLAGTALRVDVALAPLPADLQPIDSRVEDRVTGNGISTRPRLFC